jgi:ABC-2 type transport system ATP-binding protein
MNSGVLVELQDVGYRYDRCLTLEAVCLEIRRGEILGLMGRNGSGKSTLIRLLVDLLPLQSGSIFYRGNGHPFQKLPRTELGVVFQSNSLDIKLTVLENLKLMGRVYGIAKPVLYQRIEPALKFCDLWNRRNDRVQALSGGLRRRLDIVRAMLHEPKILVLDEPTSGLDEAAFRAFWDLIHMYRNHQDLTVVVATHRGEEADQCQRLALLVGGRLKGVYRPDRMRSMIQGDLLIVETPNAQTVAHRIAQHHRLKAYNQGNKVFVECVLGHEWIPKLIRTLADTEVHSISLRRPSLADVFYKLTGESLADSPACEPEVRG